MASIFTYDPDPPQVSSPWLPPEEPGQRLAVKSPQPGSPAARSSHLSDYGVTRLQAEPQDGPTEYKLHLLLRPRRAFKSMTTTDRAPSAHGKENDNVDPTPRSTAATSGLTQTRQQERLNHLTTQLLWRLQQSSPYHSSSSKELLIPRLPDGNVDIDSSRESSGLIPGLEESRGALYEIGVSDDGTLIGLTKDEMDESLSTLRRMANSLGCSVEILRKVIVGDCEWIELVDPVKDDGSTRIEATLQGRLWVAEALVTPDLGLHSEIRSRELTAIQFPQSESSGSPRPGAAPSAGSSATPQLRVTFTGPTTSGKSSLLGTLSTGTLDNGRGKSRLSLLRHRHEVKTGVTSSLAQQLIGYKGETILNFSQANIESWVDIHDCAESGRLVFVSDSGGHPRYRRTVLRGLMNWAPHWSILCIAADDSKTASLNHGATSNARDILGSAAADIDLNHAHLTLLLKLTVPMAIVITKMDLATRSSVQARMAKVLTAIKAAGRTPRILQPDQTQYQDLQQIPPGDKQKVQAVVADIVEGGNLNRYVPIVLTSAVKGTGIGLLHALLEGLPLPPKPTSRDFIGMALNPEQPKSLFHVDDTFSFPASNVAAVGSLNQSANQGIVASGYMRFGNLSVGDKIVVGPFRPNNEEFKDSDPDDRAGSTNSGLSISHPSSAELTKIAIRNAVSASATAGEWHTAQIVSVRNLRLPVRCLEAGQAGSIGLVFESGDRAGDLRRGMVLAVPPKHMSDVGLSLQAATAITATFTDPDALSLVVGSLVNVYVASVRATARIRQISHHPGIEESDKTATDDIEDVFSLNTEGEDEKGAEPRGVITRTEVFLELFQNREWIELGSRVILMEGGRQDRSGLEAFVGKIIEIVD